MARASAGNLPLRVFLLGSLRVERDAQTIHLPTRKIETLLAYLVLFPQAHAREKLAALWWGDLNDEHARASLRVALSTLRKELGDDLLLTDRETIQLNPAFPIWVDAREISDFRFRISEIENLKSKIENYRGDLLADCYDEWIAPERERLRERYHAALLQLIQHARSQSQYARAIELAQKLLDSDPANEHAHQHLIVCYAALGDRESARKQYAECRRVLRAELDVAPSPATTALYKHILARTIAPARDALFTNLPAPLSSFVGRTKEIRELKEILGTTRLVTLTGAGGCGKTRLAIQTATEIAATEKFPDGVWWIDLAALRDPALVPQAVALVFNLSASSTMPLRAVLTNFLRAKEILLVVDNCEHLLGACAPLLGTLLSACPKLVLLATSREALNLSGETVWRVPSLALPNPAHLPPLAQLRQYDAIQLFAERALAVAAHWRLAENAAPVAQVCARLDGIPLAIELAAARLRDLTAHEIASHLDDRFNLLRDGQCTVLPRHQTLRATMDWSYDLLADAERALLQRLSVFAGGFTLEAIEAVCSIQYSVFSQLNTLDLITALIDKSLVVVEYRNDAARYRLLETVREYAREKLIAQGEADQVHTRHRDYFVTWIEQAGPHLERADALVWKEHIEANYANLRVAFEHALETEPHIALRIAWGLRSFFSWRGLATEGRAWLERLLPKTQAWGEIAARARALNLAGSLVSMHFDPAGTIQFCQAALAIAQTAHTDWERAFALERLGWAYGFLPTAIPGGRDPAECCAASLKLFQDLGDETMAAWVLSFLGFFLATHDRANDRARGVRLMQQAIEQHRALGNQVGVAATAIYLGIVLTYAREVVAAEQSALEAITICQAIQHLGYLSTALMIQASAVFWQGDSARALACAVKALPLFRDTGNVSAMVMTLQIIALCLGLRGKPESAAQIRGAIEFHWETQRAHALTLPGTYDAEWATLRAQLGGAAFDRARADGRALTLEQVIEYALENVADLPGF